MWWCDGGVEGGSHHGGDGDGGGQKCAKEAAVARSPAWTRGGSLGCAWRTAREGKGEESTVASGGFLKQRRRGRGGGSSSMPCGGREWKRKRGPGRRVGQRGGTAMASSGPAEQGRGEGADRWATATVPGGGTG
jgi:hypothetical protein